jgi:hypothetical protein
VFHKDVVSNYVIEYKRNFPLSLLQRENFFLLIVGFESSMAIMLVMLNYLKRTFSLKCLGGCSNDTKVILTLQ